MIDKADLLEAFGRSVREYRERIAPPMTQERLANISGLHRTYVGDVERGTRNLSIFNVVRIAAALGIEPSDLLEGIDVALRRRHRRGAL